MAGARSDNLQFLRGWRNLGSAYRFRGNQSNITINVNIILIYIFLLK